VFRRHVEAAVELGKRPGYEYAASLLRELGRCYERAGAVAEFAECVWQEVVEPYLDDLERRARRQARGAATEIGLGLLLGLYLCRDEDDAERVRTMRACPTPSTTSPCR
jgi:hypothetical protein